MAARMEEDMEVDDPLQKGHVSSWRDFAKSQPKLFESVFVYEQNTLGHQWKLTEVQYRLIRHFCQEEEMRLNYRSAFIFPSSYMIRKIGDLSKDISCIVEDIRKKISQLYYVEMNQIVSDTFYNHELRSLCTHDCLVCQFTSEPNRGIFLFSPQQEVLNSFCERLCKEFQKRKGKSSLNVGNNTHRSSLYGGKMVSPHYPSSAPNPPNNKESNEVLTIGSMRVKIYQASILDAAKVDAIVNAANTNLTHEAGVSRIISQAAGQEYVDECGWLLRKNGPSLQTAKCYPSNPGRLKSKFTYILHAVGPRWSEYREKEDCINRLAATMKNILETAETLGIGSVAMPAIGSGGLGIPIDMCASSYIQEIAKFKEARCLKEIHLVDTDLNVVKEMIKAYRKYKEEQASTLSISTKPTWTSVDIKNEKSKSTQTGRIAANLEPLKFNIGRISVNVYQGSVLDVKADAVVNAANEALSHGAGVAYAICSAAGDEFEKACQSKLNILQRSLKTTEVIETTPGNLKYKFHWILNAVGPRWDQYSDKTQCLSDLRKTMINILSKAEELGLRKLVMPAISSGIFGVPLKLCAETYMQGLTDFCSQSTHMYMYLKEIHIVDIDVSVLTEMKDAYYNYKKDKNSISIEGARTRHPTLMTTLRSTIRNVHDRTDSVTDHTGKKMSIREKERLSTSDTGNGKNDLSGEHLHRNQRSLLKLNDEKFGQHTAKVFSFQNIMVIKIYTGSIVRFKGDALICSNDDTMSGTGFLARAVAEAGGSKYKDSISKIRFKSGYGSHKWRPGDVETCSAGNLNVRFVIHAVIDSMLTADQQNLKSYESTLRKIFDTINNYGNSKKFAMPLIGTGFVEKKVEDLQKCCTALFDVVASFCSQHAHDCQIEELHFINKNSKITSTLIDVFNANCASGDIPSVSTVKTKAAQVAVKTPKPDSSLQMSKRQNREMSGTSTQHVTSHSRSIRDFPSSGRGYSARSSSDFDEKFGARPKENLRRSRSTPSSFPEDKNTSEMDTFQQLTQSRVHDNAASKQKGNLVLIESDSDDGGEIDEPHVESKSPKSKEKDESAPCVICLCEITDGMKLDCGHEFCKDCLERSFRQHRQACPMCGKIYGIVKGNQPQNGTMKVQKDPNYSLPGFEGYGTITIKYYFPSGVQGPEHPNPGEPYEGTERRGLLPDNEEGRKVLRLLKTAFERRLVFTIGYSRTTGKDNVVTWNDIHHKTKRNTGAQNFGYPDPTYLQRVQEELAAKGVTE